MTSLSRQLQRLAVPETTVYKQGKRVASFLFEPDQAASVDKAAIYALGMRGLEELIRLDSVFEQFRDNLFNASTVDLERAMLHRTANKKLDEHIHRFFLALTPYLLFTASHQAVEWLVRCFHVNLYNVPEVLRCALHYHDCSIFARVLKVVRIRPEHHQWQWLIPVSKLGQPLTRQALCKQCLKDPSLVAFICQTTYLYTELVGPITSNARQIVLKFGLSVIWTIIAMAESLTNEIVGQIFLYIARSLKLTNVTMNIHAYGITSRLCCKVELEPAACQFLVNKIMKSLRLDNIQSGLATLILLFETQQVDTIPRKAMRRIAKKNIEIEFLCTLMKLKSKDSDGLEKMLKLFIDTLISCALEELHNTLQPCYLLLCGCLTKLQLSEDVVFNALKRMCEEYIALLRTRNTANSQEFECSYSHLARTLCCYYPLSYDAVLNWLQTKTGHEYFEEVNAFLNYGIPESLLDTSKLHFLLRHPNHLTRQLACKEAFNRLKEPNSDSGEHEIQTAILSSLEEASDPELVRTLLENIRDVSGMFCTNQLLSCLLNLYSKLIFDETQQRNVRDCLLTMAYAHEALAFCEVIACLLCNIWAHPSNDKQFIMAVLQSPIFAKVRLNLPSSADQNLQLDCWQSVAQFNHSLILCVASWMANALELVSEYDVLEKMLDFSCQSTVPSCRMLLLMYLWNRLSNCVVDEQEQSYLKLLFDQWISILPLAHMSMSAIESVHWNDYLETVDCGLLMGDSDSLELNVISIASRSSPAKVSFEVFCFVGWKLLHRLWKFEVMTRSPWWTVVGPEVTWTLQTMEWPCEILLRLWFVVTQLSSELEPFVADRLLDRTMADFIRKTDDCFKLVDFCFCHSHLTSMAAVVLEETRSRLKVLSVDELLKAFSSESAALVVVLAAMTSPSVDVRKEAALVMAAFCDRVKESAIEAAPSCLQLLQNILSKKEAIIVDANFLPIVMKSGKYDFGVLYEMIDILFADLCALPHALCTAFLNAVQLITDRGLSDRLFMVLAQLLEEEIKHISMPVLQELFRRYNKDVAHLLTTGSSGLVTLLHAIHKSASVSEVAVEQISFAFFGELPDSDAQDRVVSALLDVCTEFGQPYYNPQLGKRVLSELPISPDYLQSYVHCFVMSLDTGLSPKKKQRKCCLPEVISTSGTLVLLEVLVHNDQIKPVPDLSREIFQLLRGCQEEAVVRVYLLALLHVFEKGAASLVDSEVLGDIILNEQFLELRGIVLNVFSQAGVAGNSSIIRHTINRFMRDCESPEDCAKRLKLLELVMSSLIPSMLLVSTDDCLEEFAVKIFLDATSLQQCLSSQKEWADFFKHLLDIFVKSVDGVIADYLWLLLSVFTVRCVGEDDLQYKNSAAVLVEQLCLCLPTQEVLTACDRLFQFFLVMQSEHGAMDNLLIQMFVSAEAVLPERLDELQLETVRLATRLLGGDKLKNELQRQRRRDLQRYTPCFESLIKNIFSALSCSEEVGRGRDGPANRQTLVKLCIESLDSATLLFPLGVSLHVIACLVKRDSTFVKTSALRMLDSKLASIQQTTSEEESSDTLVDVVRSLNASFPKLGDSKEEQLLFRIAVSTIQAICEKIGAGGSEEFLKSLSHVCTASHDWKEMDGHTLCVVFDCLGELVNCTNSSCLPLMPKFVEILLDVLNSSRMKKVSTRRSALRTLDNVVNALANFLTPYLSRLFASLTNVHWLLANGSAEHQELVESVLQRLAKLSARLLLPVVEQVSVDQPAAIPFAFRVLKEHIACQTGQQIAKRRAVLDRLFLCALDQCGTAETTAVDAGQVQQAVIDAFVQYSLKSKESDLEVLMQTLVAWAVETEQQRMQRTLITFRLAIALTDRIGHLFLGIAGCFLPACADMLDRAKDEADDSEITDQEGRRQMVVLALSWLVKCCALVATGDSEKAFITPSRFEALMNPVVDQLDNVSICQYKAMVNDCLIPCVVGLARAVADDSLWRRLSYAILMKGRNTDAQVRLAALSTFGSLVEELKEDAAALIPESVQFIGELIEDPCEDVEELCHKVIQTCEQIIGESLQKYF